MVDLHMHTNYSDGEFSPIELLKKCQDAGLTTISVTDHDKCSAYNDFSAINTGDFFDGTIITGVELTTLFEGRTVEILGYNIDIKIVQEYLDSFYTEEAIKERLLYSKTSVIKNLNNLGILVNLNNLDPNVSFDVAIYNEIINNNNIDILDEELRKSVKNFFRLGICNPKSPLFVDMSHFRPTPKVITDLIHKAGGKAFLAHPCQYAFDNKIEMIDNIRKVCDIDGIECYHSTFTSDEMNMLFQYANENDLLISGGSDYHGKVKPDIFLGTGINNNLCISKEKISWLNR